MLREVGQLASAERELRDAERERSEADREAKSRSSQRSQELLALQQEAAHVENQARAGGFAKGRALLSNSRSRLLRRSAHFVVEEVLKHMAKFAIHSYRYGETILGKMPMICTRSMQTLDRFP